MDTFDDPLRKDRLDRLMEIISYIGLALSFVPLFFYNNIGDGTALPIHYNGQGEIDGYGSKSFLWMAPILTTVLFIGLTILEKFYKRLNYPCKVTSENAPSIYRSTVRIIRCIRTLFMILFAYINLSTLASIA